MGVVTSSGCRWWKSRGEEKGSWAEIHPSVTSDVFRRMNTNGNAFSFFAMKHPCMDSHFFRTTGTQTTTQTGWKEFLEKSPLARTLSNMRTRHAAAAHNSRSACLKRQYGEHAASVYICVPLFICTTAAATASGADEEMRQLEQFITRAEFAHYLHLGCLALIFIQFAGADITQM